MASQPLRPEWVKNPTTCKTRVRETLKGVRSMKIQVEVHYKPQSFAPFGERAEAIRRVVAGHFFAGGKPVRPEDVAVFFSRIDWESDRLHPNIHFVVSLLVDHGVRRSEDLARRLKEDVVAVLPGFSEQHVRIVLIKSEMF